MAGTSILRCCPSSISSADHGVVSLQGALKDSSGEAVAASGMPEPSEFPSLVVVDPQGTRVVTNVIGITPSHFTTTSLFGHPAVDGQRAQWAAVCPPQLSGLGLVELPLGWLSSPPAYS